MPTPAVILLSGGLDSATVLALAVSRGHRCLALTFDYAQRHRHEIDAARTLAASLRADEHRVIRLDPRAFEGSALTRGHDPRWTSTPSTATDTPHRSTAHAPHAPHAPTAPAVPKHHEPTYDPTAPGSPIPITYVPARNLVFLAMAVATAESISARDIYIGVNAVDYSGYPDCRPAFIQAMQHAARLGTKAGVEADNPPHNAPNARPITIHDPLVRMTKADIIRLGLSLGVDYALTTSCYDPAPDPANRPLPCGSCDACILRARGFADAGIPDPALLATGHAR